MSILEIEVFEIRRTAQFIKIEVEFLRKKGINK